jgi:O-antigen ligase
LEPHNLFVAILYDHGVIGLTLLILVFITLFVSLIAGMRKTTGAHQMLFLTALAILASVLIQSFGATDILSQNIGLYFWIIMALPFALYWSVSKQLTETKEGVLDDDEAKIPRMPARQRKERDQISAV